MREGTYPQDECLRAVSSPKAGSLLLFLSRRCVGQQLLLLSGCLWGPSHQTQSGSRFALADQA